MRVFGRLGAVALAILLIGQIAGVARATNYAGLVIRHGDGSVVTRCVAFEEGSISGIELLYRSGLSVDAPTSGYGASVFGIDGEGTAEDWSSGRASWSYWHLRGGWVFSPVGASSYSVKPGDVEGWSWGSQTGATAPPVYTFDELFRDTYGTPEPTPPPAAGSQPSNDTTAAPATTNTSGGTGSTGSPAAAGTSGSTQPNLVSGKGAKAAATATAKKISDSKKPSGRARGNVWDYAAFVALLAALSAGSVYYVRKNRKPKKA